MENDHELVTDRGPFDPRIDVNAMMILAILLLLKRMELLQNGLQPHSQATQLISIRVVLLASS